MNKLITKCLIAIAMLHIAAAQLAAQNISWSEDFTTNPISAGRMAVPAGHDASRFTYNSAGHFLTVHYDTILPTAWCIRPIDPQNGRSLGACDDFTFDVTFRIHSAGFYADPNNYAELGWGLINSSTTGLDRAGGSAGPYAFDCVSLDYFPNISPIFGGPDIGPTVIHSNEGQGFFGAIEYPFGAEAELKASHGDQIPALDTIYTARIAYNSVVRTAVLTIRSGSQYLQINVDGDGGPGGPDGNPATIQNILFMDSPFSVDRFALTAWQDTYNPDSSSVIADIDILGITFSASPLVKGDMNDDGKVDGRDIALFVNTISSVEPAACSIARADFNNDTFATIDDVAGFVSALLSQ